jgi:hypothetical protein
VTDRSGHQRIATPFFVRGTDHHGDALHWLLRRRRLQTGDGSTDVMLAFVDTAFHPVATADRVVSVENYLP